MKEAPDIHIAALLERIGRLLASDAQANGLLPVHWETLRYLDRANRFSMTAAALTAYLGLTKGTVSQSLNSLETKGLVRKRVDLRDRRSKRLSLTAEGKALLKNDPLLLTSQAINALSPSAKDALADSLQTFLSQRLATQDRQAFGQCRDCRYFARRHEKGKPFFCQLLQEPLNESDSLSICYEQQPA